MAGVDMISFVIMRSFLVSGGYRRGDHRARIPWSQQLGAAVQGATPASRASAGGTMTFIRVTGSLKEPLLRHRTDGADAYYAGSGSGCRSGCLVKGLSLCP